MPVHIVLSGLPGVGKSTVAQDLVRQSGALWLRIDAIEAAMRASHMKCEEMADGGYGAAQAVAKQALRQGMDVVSDSVNPIELTRRDWRVPARVAGARHVDVWLRCSDKDEHRRRVEARRQTGDGGTGLPDWAAVQARAFEPWAEGQALTYDTGSDSAQDVASAILRAARAGTCDRSETCMRR